MSNPRQDHAAGASDPGQARSRTVSPDKGYVGRFAPSPSGPLHRGSLLAAMASYLDARAHAGRWLLRIEDIDRQRSREDATQSILQDLSRLGFQWDETPWLQSRRLGRYQQVFNQLRSAGRVYPCSCSRKEIADSIVPTLATTGVQTLLPHTPVYPGTCRPKERSLQGPAPGRSLRAWRFRVEAGAVSWTEGAWLKASAGAHCGQTIHEDVAQAVGDFVLARPATGGELDWTYQLSVVVDDADAGVTHVVRGMDLIESTGRQIKLQQSLGLATPQYWHCPLVFGGDGQKLSKQNGAAALDTSRPVQLLHQAIADLQLPAIAGAESGDISLAEFWRQAIASWRQLRLRQSDKIGPGEV